MPDEHDKRPIIIKRIKKVHAGHHGGSWKIAYADFVTAMMAFFLLMWLLSMMNKYQLQGIAEYFKKPLKEVFSKQDNIAKTDTLKPDKLGPTTYKNSGLKEKTENTADKNLGVLDKTQNPTETICKHPSLGLRVPDETGLRKGSRTAKRDIAAIRRHCRHRPVGAEKIVCI